MKTRILITIIFSFLLIFISIAKDMNGQKTENTANATVRVHCTQELNSLASSWIGEYEKINPGEKIELVTGIKSGEILAQNELAVMSSGENDGIDRNWQMIVGREIIVPVINAANPCIEKMIVTGISGKQLAGIVGSDEVQGWESLVYNTGNNPVHLFVSDDPTVIAAMKNFLAVDQLPEHRISFENENMVLTRVLNDPYAIGFCKLNSITSESSQMIIAGIRLLPLDKNGNGKLDYMESIYTDAESLVRGVWVGKYPKELVNQIRVVSANPPSGEAQLSFLNWLLTTGQKTLVESGYTPLVYSELQAKLDKIEMAAVETPAAPQVISYTKLIVFVAVISIVVLLIIVTFIGYRRTGSETTEELQAGFSPVFDEKALQAPAGLFYSKSHTWAFMEKDGTVKIGIDDFLQHITGAMTRLEMKTPGEKVKKGEAFLSLIQKGKQLKIYAPVSGTIVERNNALAYNPASLNSSPYSDGWIYKIEPTAWLQEIPLLNMADKYTRWLSGEINRLKDFLASTLSSRKMEYAGVILQDGGMLKNNLLEDFGPEIWEDFQSQFLDKE